MTDLERRQKAGQRVEDEMLKYLLHYYPVYELKVNDILSIAGHARALAFDAFDPGNADV